MKQIEELDIPDKTFFKIGEVAKILDLEPYVLRYWESEFDMLEPDKTDSGQRSYQREDIELICQIRSLLYDEMFTIAGARRQLELEVEGKPNLVTPDALLEPGAQPPQTDLWEQRTASQAVQIEELEAQLAELQDQSSRIDELEAQLADTDTQLADFDAQKARVAELEAKLAGANQTIAKLKSRPTRSASTSTSLDPAILDGLRRQVQNLATLAQRPY